MKFKEIPKLTESAGMYGVDVDIASFVNITLKRFLSGETGAPLVLNPDYQRGHVWTEAQQIAFIEFLLRGGKD